MSESNRPVAGEKYAWLELMRKDLPKRSASERVADFLEIYGPYDEATAREQAARCVQCPEPICVSGCPLGSPIPEWLFHTAEGQFLEAAALTASGNTFPEICSRLCASDRHCEGRCILNGQSEPVSIRAIEQFLNDYAFKHGGTEQAVSPPNGLKVAVVGAGPGGLTCADELSRKGYAVTVFDSGLVPGGLLVNGTPALRMDRSLVQRRIGLLEQRGVVFTLGVTLGKDVHLEELTSQFDAVYLGFGARKARLLQVPGADLKGVVEAVPFLMHQNPGVQPSSAWVRVRGQRVAVLGGGDTAIECLRLAIRCGARQAVGIYRRGPAEMTCSRREYENAVEEGVELIWQAAPVEVLGNQRGRVTGLRLVRTAWGADEADGRRGFRISPGSEFEIPVDRVIAALGFERTPLARPGDFDVLKTDGHDTVLVDDRQMTSVPGVFAGGDIVRGKGSVLHSVRDARCAALGIEAHLGASRGERASGQRTSRSRSVRQ